MTYQTAVESPAAQRARERLELQFQLGQQKQDELLQKVANTVIKDRLIDPKLLRTRVRSRQLFLALGGGQWATVHSHAIGQLCDRSDPKLPRHFMRNLIDGPPWQQRLSQILFNVCYGRGTYLNKSKEPAKFMGRFVGPQGQEEMRGFVSQYFARHLATLPMLRGFVHASARVGAKPIEARASDLRFSLKSFLPFVFEPIAGRFFSFGVEFSNSDFADGSLKVALCSRNTTTNITAVLETSWSRTHLGSIVKESELQLSAGAQAREVDAVVTILMEAVEKSLSPDNINKMLYVFEKAEKEEVPWHRLKKEMGRILREKELEDVKKLLDGDTSIEELPPVGRDEEGNPIPSRWWASEVAGFLATKEINPDRQADLERLAGTLLKAG